MSDSYLDVVTLVPPVSAEDVKEKLSMIPLLQLTAEAEKAGLGLKVLELNHEEWKVKQQIEERKAEALEELRERKKEDKSLTEAVITSLVANDVAVRKLQVELEGIQYLAAKKEVSMKFRSGRITTLKVLHRTLLALSGVPVAED